MTIDTIIPQLLVAALIWFLGDILINTFVTSPSANKALHIILLVAVLLIAIFGGLFFPRLSL